MTTLAWPPLLDAADLVAYEGAPFPPDLVDAACSQVRGEAGWHIAPLIEHDVVLASGTGRTHLLVPSLRIASITEVRDADRNVVLTGWRSIGSGMLARSLGWPRGDANIAVTLTHGHDTVPAELVAVVAERARALAMPAPLGVSADEHTVGAVTRRRTYRDGTDTTDRAGHADIDPRVARHRVGGWA